MKTTRREFVIGSSAIALYPPWLLHAEDTAAADEPELWYSKPASRWMEALPVGNGRIGGMVYGGTSVERIDLTESTVWSGAPSDHNVNPTALENLGPIRELMFAGKYSEANALCKQHLLGHSSSFGTNLPMASLQLTFAGDAPTQRYRRSLNLGEEQDTCTYASSRDILLLAEVQRTTIALRWASPANVSWSDHRQVRAERRDWPSRCCLQSALASEYFPANMSS